jgi:hypothetical protein
MSMLHWFFVPAFPVKLRLCEARRLGQPGAVASALSLTKNAVGDKGVSGGVERLGQSRHDAR